MKNKPKSSKSVKKKSVAKKKVAVTAKKKGASQKSAKTSRKTVAKKATAKKKAASKAAKKTTSAKPVKKASRIKKPVLSEPSISVTSETTASIVTVTKEEPVSVEPLPGLFIGKVSHYYNHSNVAVLDLEAGSLRVGDTICIKGHTTDFEQSVGSMQIEHENIEHAEAGQTIGLKVREAVREHDRVYKKV